MGSPEPKNQKTEKQFAEILEKEPLYRNFENVVGCPTFVNHGVVPGGNWRCPTINLPCKCSTTPTTTWVAKEPESLVDSQSIFHLEYICQGCGKERRSFTYVFQKPPVPSGYRTEKTKPVEPSRPVLTSCHMMKIGQWPKLVTAIDQQVARFVGEDNADLLRKALMSRHSSHGVGALAYLRRVIENITESYRKEAVAKDKISDTSVTGYQAYEARFDEVKDFIPEQLKGSDGFNPLREIHARASAGIHGKNENECLAIYDALAEIVSHVAREMEDLEHKKRKSALIQRLKNS